MSRNDDKIDLGLFILSIGLSTMELVRDKGPKVQIKFSSFILKGLSQLLQTRHHT